MEAWVLRALAQPDPPRLEIGTQVGSSQAAAAPSEQATGTAIGIGNGRNLAVRKPSCLHCSRTSSGRLKTLDRVAPRRQGGEQPPFTRYSVQLGDATLTEVQTGAATRSLTVAETSTSPG